MSMTGTIEQLPQSLDEFKPAMKLVTKMSCSEIVAYLADETLPNKEKTIDCELKNNKYLGNLNITNKVLYEITQIYEDILRTRIIEYMECEDIEDNMESSIQKLKEQVDWNLFPELETIQQKKEYISKNVYSILYLQYVYWCAYNSLYEYENFKDIECYHNDIDYEYERELDIKYAKKYCR